MDSVANLLECEHLGVVVEVEVTIDDGEPTTQPWLRPTPATCGSALFADHEFEVKVTGGDRGEGESATFGVFLENKKIRKSSKVDRWEGGYFTSSKSTCVAKTSSTK